MGQSSTQIPEQTQYLKRAHILSLGSILSVSRDFTTDPHLLNQNRRPHYGSQLLRSICNYEASQVAQW